jgi:hypothetical protein
MGKSARIGRPTKKLKVGEKIGERVPLSLRVTAKMKRDLDARAEKNGRSLSQEAEYLIERSFTYDSLNNWLVTAMNMTMGDIARGTAEAAFRKLGYDMVRDKDGRKAWLEPGHGLAMSGFVADDKGEPK